MSPFFYLIFSPSELFDSIYLSIIYHGLFPQLGLLLTLTPIELHLLVHMLATGIQQSQTLSLILIFPYLPSLPLPPPPRPRPHSHPSPSRLHPALSLLLSPHFSHSSLGSHLALAPALFLTHTFSPFLLSLLLSHTPSPSFPLILPPVICKTIFPPICSFSYHLHRGIFSIFVVTGFFEWLITETYFGCKKKEGKFTRRSQRHFTESRGEQS